MIWRFTLAPDSDAAETLLLIDAKAIFLLSHALLGAALGFRSQVKGLAVLIAVVATTTSLSWHVGWGHLPAIHLYALGLFVGTGVYEITHRNSEVRPGRNELPRPLAICVALVFLTFLTASVVSAFRVRLPWSPTPDLPWGSVARDLLTYYPSGLAGRLQATYVALMGPALFLMTVRYVVAARDRRLIRNAFACGLLIAILGPVLQFAISDPWVRSDTGTTALGVSGFFHDTHSFAAYLVLGISITLGVAIGWAASGSLGYSAASFMLAIAAGVVLLYTNSRGGLLAMLGSVLVLAALVVTFPRSRRADGKPSWVQATCIIVILSIVLLSTLLITSPSSRDAAHEQLVKLGNPRMWEFLRSDLEIQSMATYEIRVALWEKAIGLIQQRPLWGVGPQMFYETDWPLTRADGTPLRVDVRLTQHPHNYYLQIAAENGLPALAAYVLLVAGVFIMIGRAVWTAPDPLQRGMIAGIAAGQVGIVACALVSHPFLLAELQVAYWSLAGLGVTTALSNSPGTSLETRRPADLSCGSP